MIPSGEASSSTRFPRTFFPPSTIRKKRSLRDHQRPEASQLYLLSRKTHFLDSSDGNDSRRHFRGRRLGLVGDLLFLRSPCKERRERGHEHPAADHHEGLRSVAIAVSWRRCPSRMPRNAA